MSDRKPLTDKEIGELRKKMIEQREDIQEYLAEQGVDTGAFADTPPNTTELVAVEDALDELREHGSGSATDIDPDELAERVSNKVVADLRDM